MAWVDPRFRTKKDKKLKPIQLNKFGEAACDIRSIVPGRASAASSVASGSRASGSGFSGVSRPSSVSSRVSRPSTAKSPIARPGTAAPCRTPAKSPARPPPLATTGSVTKQVGVSWRSHPGSGLRPPSSVKQLRAPGTSSQSPCPPAPCPPAPCPQTTSPPRTARAPSPRRTCPPTPQRSLRAPASYSGPSTSRASSAQPKSQKIVLLPGDINPEETTVITVEPPPPKKKPKGSVRFVSTKSIKPRPAWVGPCPEPEPEPEPQAPRGELLQISPPRVAGPPRRPPPRFARFGASFQSTTSAPAPCPPAPCPQTQSRPAPCPQVRAPSPPAPCPQVRAPSPPAPCPEEAPEDPCEYDLIQDAGEPEPCEEPSDEECPPAPCNPDDDWFEQMMSGRTQQQATPSQQSVITTEYSSIIDITPPEGGRISGFERVVEEYPEELIQWDESRDPFSPPPPASTPPESRCIDFVGKQDPFSPPTMGEYLAKRYILPQETLPSLMYARPEKFDHEACRRFPKFLTESPEFPELNFNRPCSPSPPPPPRLSPRVSPRLDQLLPPQLCTPTIPRAGPSRRRSPIIVDREIRAKSVPHNKRVSTICRDQSVDELGLLPDDVMGSEDFEVPLLGARHWLRMKRDPLETEHYDPKTYRQQEQDIMIGKQIERKLAEQAQDVEEFLQKPAVSPTTLEADAAYRRVMERYNFMYGRKDDGGGTFGTLQEETCDDIDFDAIESLDCD